MWHFGSKAEERVYLALSSPTSQWHRYTIQGQISWSSIFKNCNETKRTVDLWIPQLLVAIEIHGRQHYEPVDFSGKSSDGGLSKYREQVRRDSQLRYWCEYSNCSLVELNHRKISTLTDEELTSWIDKKILEAI